MALFILGSEDHYAKSHDVFKTKCGQHSYVMKMLQDHIPALIQRRQQQSHFNILSVGSGSGEVDMEIQKIIKQELLKSEATSHMKMFNRAIEPNEYSCSLYKAAIENLPSTVNDQLTHFELCQQTFQEYKESQQGQESLMKFDMVHFIHSIYYVDIEQALIHCFEKELCDEGAVLCILDGKDLMYSVTQKQSPRQWHGKSTADSESYETAEKIIKIANDNGWKHEIYTQEYPIDVNEVFDEKSTEGNLLLDFLTHTVNFRETADKQLVEETLALITDLTTVKDGKRVGEKKDSILFIYSSFYGRRTRRAAILNSVTIGNGIPRPCHAIQYGGRGRNTVILFRCETEIPIYFSPRPGRQGNVCLAAYHFIGFSREMTVYFPLKIQLEYCVINFTWFF